MKVSLLTHANFSGHYCHKQCPHYAKPTEEFSDHVCTLFWVRLSESDDKRPLRAEKCVAAERKARRAA